MMVIELSGVQFWLKSYAEFEITRMISDQNCTTRGSITTLLHPFWNHPNTGLGQFKYFIDAVLSWFEIKFIHFWGGKNKKVAKFATWSTLSFNLIGYFKRALKSDWSFFFSVTCSLVGKKMRFKEKMVWFKNKSHQLEPIRLQRPPVISKWV